MINRLVWFFVSNDEKGPIVGLSAAKLTILVEYISN